MMKFLIPTQLQESVRPGRIQALMDLRFPMTQARFLVHVLVFSGVFLERQYRAFTGVAHGQKTHDFLRKLVANGYATPMTPGALHRGRFFHVQYKPLYAAIGQPNNRNRRPASIGRVVERLMLLDAVLADRRHTWLGTEQDKREYFREALDRDLLPQWYPHVTFGDGMGRTMRFFPEKLPIGVPRGGGRRHVFLYLATREVPAEFRTFLLRHAQLLMAIDEWTVRVLLPRRLRKAAAVYRYAFRDAFMLPLEHLELQQLDWYFRGRSGHIMGPSPWRDVDFTTAARTFSAARYEALYRVWKQEESQALYAAQTRLLRDQIQRGDGRLEFAELPHQYLQLTPLVGTSTDVENGVERVDDLTLA